MKIILNGFIKENNPIIRGSITTEGQITFKKRGNVYFTLDTGFNGGIALPKEIIAKLNTELFGSQKFILANGKEVKLNLYIGKIIIQNKMIKSYIVEGDFLLGMEVMSSIADILKLNFRKKKIVLLK